MKKNKLLALSLTLALATASVLPALAYTNADPAELALNVQSESAIPLAEYCADGLSIMGTKAEIAPYWNSTNAILTDFSINWLGKASANVTYSTWNGQDSIYLTVKIKKLTNGMFTDYYTFSGASGTGTATLSSSYYISDRGTYALEVTGTVYTSSGTKVETVTVYSDMKTY